MTVKVGARVLVCEWLFMSAGQEFEQANFLKFNDQSLSRKGDVEVLNLLQHYSNESHDCLF